MTGRSSLLRAALAEVPRRRRFALRALGLAGLAGAVGLPVAAVLGRWFDPAGPGRLLYRLHDDLALPLWARLWTAGFPGALVWLVPAAGLALLALAEALGLGQPLRRAQVAVLRQVPGRGLVAWHRALRPLGAQSTLARAVVAEELALAEARAWRARLAGGAPDPALGRLAALWADLGEGTAEDRLRLAELAALAGPGGLDRRLRDWGDTPVAPLSLADILAAAARLRRGELPEDPARLAIAAALGAGERAEALAFWDAWAAARLGGSAALERAEAAIAFDRWAAWVEAQARAPAAAGLLAEAFPETARPRPHGEGFAARAAGFDP